MNIETPTVDRVLEGSLLGLILIWGVYILVESYTYDAIFAWLFPTLVAIPLVILITIQVISWRSAKLQSYLYSIKIDTSININDVAKSADTYYVLIIFITTISYVILATLVGFFYAMPAFLFLFFYLLDCYDLKRSVWITFLIWFTVSFLFGSVFNVPGVDFGPFSRFDLGIFG